MPITHNICIIGIPESWVASSLGEPNAARTGPKAVHKHTLNAQGKASFVVCMNNSPPKISGKLLSTERKNVLNADPRMLKKLPIRPKVSERVLDSRGSMVSDLRSSTLANSARSMAWMEVG
jgi:hypothetical protein